MGESPTPAPPSPSEAREWVGWRVDEIGGAGVGQVEGVYVDAESGNPTWLIAKHGRIGATLVAIPLRDCAAGSGRIWVAHEREAIRRSPVVDPTRPLLREHELTICAHYGVGEQVGRAADVAGRAEGSVTSTPLPS